MRHNLQQTVIAPVEPTTPIGTCIVHATIFAIIVVLTTIQIRVMFRG